MLWLVLTGALLTLIVLVTWARLPAFLSLLMVALMAGLAAGMAPEKVLLSIQSGVGSTLGSLVFVLTLGVILGGLLSETGAIQAISSKMLLWLGPASVHWALAMTSFCVGIALFYNAGFVVLAPFVFAIATETQRPLLPLALAMAAPLSVTHGFLPPHPGATAVAVVFGADMGKTLLLGLMIALPTVVLAAVIFPARLGAIRVQPPESLQAKPAVAVRHDWVICLLLSLFPVLLMASSAVAAFILPKEMPANRVLAFLGDPGIALLVAVLPAMVLLTKNRFNTNARNPEFRQVMERVGPSLQTAAVLLLVIGAGGAFKQVLIDSGLSEAVTGFSKTLHWSPLVLGWAVATLMRIAVGSATVAGMTAAGIVQPFLQQNECISPELMTLAVGAGSLMCSHVNDTGFWMFKEWFGLSLADTFKTWTLMETIVGVCGLAGVLLLDIWV